MVRDVKIKTKPMDTQPWLGLHRLSHYRFLAWGLTKDFFNMQKGHVRQISKILFLYILWVIHHVETVKYMQLINSKMPNRRKVNNYI